MSRKNRAQVFRDVFRGKRGLADGKPKIENNKEVMIEKVQTAKCFKVSAFCSELVPPDSQNFKENTAGLQSSLA